MFVLICPLSFREKPVRSADENFSVFGWNYKFGTNAEGGRRGSGQESNMAKPGGGKEERSWGLKGD